LAIDVFPQIFFGASDMQLDAEDVVYPQEVDAEILGSGVVMAFTVISPLILLAYAVEGRKNVQATSLDTIFCFVAAATLIAAGGEINYEKYKHRERS
jgi:hypothetical protein